MDTSHSPSIDTLPSAGTTRPLAVVSLADVVRLYRPYHPASGFEQQHGPFPLGIVAEILCRLPDGRPRNVSLYLYDPQRRTLYLGPNGIPAFVDFHCADFELYKRAADSGYHPLA